MADAEELLSKLSEESQKKAKESEAILALQLKQLEESFNSRIDSVRQEQEADRAKGQERAQELFPEGSLGRVDETAGQDIQNLVTTRQQQIDDIRAAGTQALADRSQLTSDSAGRIDALEAGRRDPNSELAKLQRSTGNQNIQQALRTQLRSINSQANALGVRGGAGALQDALASATLARGNLERDIALGNASAADQLALQSETIKERGQTAKEDLRLKQTAQQDDLQRRLEDLQGAIREDTLRRQLINLDNRSREIFGRLGTEENIVAQGVAERSGVRQSILAESSQAEATRAQREAEDLRKQEIDKPPPSGGGKIICTELHAQGLLDSYILEGDAAYAATMPLEIKVGYWSWARYIVKYMRQSKFFTYGTAPFIQAWATEMAYRAGYIEKGSLLGKVMSWIGEPTCYLLGKAIMAFKGVNHGISWEVE